MPVIGIPVAELKARLGCEVERDRLLKILEGIGCDVEGYEHLGRVRCNRCAYVMELVGREEPPPRCDRCDADLRAPDALAPMSGIEVIRMELLAVRPDLFDPGGLARALRGILDVEVGLPEYPVGPPVAVLRTDGSVRRERSLRPSIAAAVLEGARLDPDRIKMLMKMQENLHWALGRDRRHASIGVYDLDAIATGDAIDAIATGGGRSARDGATAATSEAPRELLELEYTTAAPEEWEFVPLGASGVTPSDRRSLRRILEEHPKGIAYAHLLAGFDRYPLLRAREGVTLSMPPIINSEETKVHEGTRRLFIDVTGTGRRIVHRTLNILVTSLLEMQPEMRLFGVRIVNDAGEEEITPDLSPQEAWIDPAHAARLLGVPLSPDELCAQLLRMRHGLGPDLGRSHGGSRGGGSGSDGSGSGGLAGGGISVRVPAYRNDILHERDLMEDVGIAYGYTRIARTLVPARSVGRERETERRTSALRDVLIGLGFVEIMSLVLTSPETSDRLLDLPDHPGAVLLDNPISLEQTQLRTSLLPGLLQTFARNRHNPLPQAIFEVGDITLLDAGAETGARERRHAAFALTSPRASFADARALAEALVRELGWEFRPRAQTLPFLLEGRGAVIAGDSERDIVSGVFGEIHPRVLERLGLQNPAIVCEIAVPDGDEPWPYLSLG